MNTGQTKFASFVEACVNTFVGLIFSYTIQIILIEVYEVPMSNTTAMHFVFWFTVASVLRSYIIRRIGNLPYWEQRRERRRLRKLRKICKEEGHSLIPGLRGEAYCKNCCQQIISRDEWDTFDEVYTDHH